MKPYVKLAEARLPDGTLFSLHKHDGKFYLKNDRLDLMSTALTFSEQMLAEKGCVDVLADSLLRPKHPQVLIGGLGMGFTLKRTLEFIEWNRTFLVEYNGPLLDDPRTEIYQGDLYDCLAERGQKSYDAVLIDIDDAPDMLITKGNERLYKGPFLTTLLKALSPEGCLAFWLAEKLAECRIQSAGLSGQISSSFQARSAQHHRGPQGRVLTDSADSFRRRE